MMNPAPEGRFTGPTKTRSREYEAWTGMIKRCESPRAASYPRYGGRGIKVCARWRESFDVFLADMGRKPTAKHSLDRIDADGDYEPSNCRWATDEEQAFNRSSTRTLTFRGRTLSLAAWARDTGLPYMTLVSRVNIGWPVRRVLTEPVNDPSRRARTRAGRFA